MQRSPLTLCLALLLLPAPCRAVIIDLGDGTGNTSAPAPDPGWSHVGTRGSLTVVHLGDGWILTANHVGAGDVTIGGTLYPYVPGTEVQLSNPDSSLADLLLFGIYPFPLTSLLPIAGFTPAIGTSLTMIGFGRNRGPGTSWDANGPPPPGPIFGYDWGAGRSLRWGHNHVEDVPMSPVLGTWCFASFFDADTGTDESQAANGDSGGPAFAWDGSDWVLVGLMFSIAEYGGQPTEASLYGQLTYFVDLASYRDEIIEVTGLPEPSSGLAAGLLLLVALSRRRAVC